MGETTMTVEKDVENLKAELAHLRTDLGELLGVVKNLGVHTAGTAREKAQAEIERCVQQLNEACKSLGSRGKETAGQVHHAIEERPLTTAALAFGVGLALGKLLSGKCQ